MATRADIEINVKGLKKVQELSRQLDKVSSKVNSLNKRGAGSSANKNNRLEQQSLSIQEKKRASMVRVRSIGDQIQKAKEAGLKTDRASRALNRAVLANSKGKFKLAKASSDAALLELKALKEQSKELTQQKILRASRGGGSGGFRGGGRRDERSNRAALTSGAISGAFPLLFGQGPIGGLAGFAGGFAGTKIAGQMGGFAGGLVATAVLQQLTTAKEKLEELGKAVTFFSFDVSAATKALGLAGTPQAEYIKLIEKSQGKQAAFNLVMQDMEQLVGEDGVKALQDFAEGTRELQSEITRFLTEVAANVAKLFSGGDGGGRVTGLSRRSLLADALSSDNPEIKALLEERKTANRNRRDDINDQIVVLMQAEKSNKKNLDLEKLRTEQYNQITKSVENKNLFLNESLTLGTREAEIQEKLREFDRKALEFDEKINMEERKQFENALRLQEELARVNTLYQGIASTVQSGLVDAIEGAINGTKTLGDVARSVFGAIQRQLIDFAATSFLRAIPGIGGFFANGGRPPVGKPSIVGERGPELFVPNSAGTIIPNHELGGMGGSTNIVVNVDASGSSVEGDEQQSRELGRLISVAVQSEILQQKRPGGLLA